MQISVKLNFPICFPFLAPRGKRGWKTFYAVLKGTVLYLQKVKVDTQERKPTPCPARSPRAGSATASSGPASWSPSWAERSTASCARRAEPPTYRPPGPALFPHPGPGRCREQTDRTYEEVSVGFLKVVPLGPKPPSKDAAKAHIF